MCYIFIDINNMLYWYNFFLYWCDAFIIIKWLKIINVHGWCKVFYNMCFNSINKKIKKQIKKLLFVTEKCNMEK
jgi:hypothetical protein